MYFHRLRVLKSRLLSKCEKKWGEQTVNDIKPVYVDKILDIRTSEPSWIIGTIFSDLKYKPNVLKDVAEDMYGAPPIPPEAYSDPENDQIMIEDESGRVILAGALLEKVILVSGNVVGLLGAEVQAGIFEVVDVCYPELAPQLPRKATSTGNKIAFISGMGINSSNYQAWKFELLKEFLVGNLLPGQAKTITRLVIAGNSTLVNHDAEASAVKLSEKDKYKLMNKSNFNAKSINLLDELLSEILISLPVTILPGESDPAEITYPQLALHNSFFPRNKHLINTTYFQKTTNPTWLEIDDCRILGTSGENITDIYKYLLPLDKFNQAKARKEDTHEELQEVGELVTLCPEDSRMPIIEATLRCQNLVPTAPDTLCCYPYEEEDPFLLEETPHVYFVGNQPKFESKIVSLDDFTVRLISIPRFDLTGEVVLMDTSTLECEVIQLASSV